MSLTMRPRQAIAYAVVGVGLVALLWPIMAHAIDVWSTDEEFTYGFLIPPMAAALLWWRRSALRNAIGEGRQTGLIIVALAVLAMLVSRRIGINALGGIAVTPLLIGIAVYLWGWRAGRVV